MSGRSPMTVGRQILGAHLASLVVMLALIVVAVLALNRVADSKDRVINRDSRLVADAYRLDLSVAERGVAVRNLLITGDNQYLQRIDEADADYDDAHRAIEARVHTDAGRSLLDDIDEHRAELHVVTADLIERRQAETLTDERLAAAITDRLTPARRAVTETIDAFIDRQEELILDAVDRSNGTASNTTRLLWGMGLVGVAAAVGVGGAITRNVARRLTGLALSVDAAAAEILAGTAQHVATASEQAAAVQQTVATADELAQTADQSADRARVVAESATRSAAVAEDGTAAVSDSAAAMIDIREQVDTIAERVVALAERAQDISSIVATIEGLAEEIHLLALNAAIEAARAGEHGRGFSVVASEVRALADESKRATSQIADILGEIQRGTNTAVMATEQGGKSVAAGVERIQRTGATIEALAETVASSAIAAEQISASSGQQAIATAQISQAMRDLDEAAQQNAAAAKQAEEAARDLNRVAADLKALVGAP